MPFNRFCFCFTSDFPFFPSVVFCFYLYFFHVVLLLLFSYLLFCCSLSNFLFRKLVWGQVSLQRQKKKKRQMYVCEFKGSQGYVERMSQKERKERSLICFHSSSIFIDKSVWGSPLMINLSKKNLFKTRSY